MRFEIPSGTATGVGSLPHRDAAAAADFALRCTPGLPAIPTLPHRSGAEGMIAQAVLGIPGVSLGQYGAVAVDPGGLHANDPIETDLAHDAFGGLRAFVAEAQYVGYTGPVKWQLAGPVTLGVNLMRAGATAHQAFDVAVQAVRARLVAINAYLNDALPTSKQLVVLDEPALEDAGEAEFPLPLDNVIDLMSNALAAVESVAMTGVHCCDGADWASVIAAGPDVLSVPADERLLPVGGMLARFLESGGTVMWGVITTDGPLIGSIERPWRDLMSLWAALAERGCDPERLVRQTLVSPVCGMGLHANGVAEQAFDLTRQISARMADMPAARRVTG